MKKIAVVVAVLIGLFTVQSRADQDTINLYAAQLETSGSAPVADTMLVQLLGDTTSTFGAPTAASFTGTDANETVLWSGTISTADAGVAGGVAAQVKLTLGGVDTSVGNYLLLRWYPTLNLSAADPGAGAAYGQFSTLVSNNDGSNMDWQVQSAGTYTLNFLTSSQGGSEPNSAGVANLAVPSAVPEPGSMALAVSALGLGAMVLRRRK